MVRAAEPLQADRPQKKFEFDVNRCRRRALFAMTGRKRRPVLPKFRKFRDIEDVMKKLIAAVIVGLFATAAFAQTPASDAAAPAAASTAKKSTHKKHAKKHAKKAASASAASAAK